MTARAQRRLAFGTSRPDRRIRDETPVGTAAVERDQVERRARRILASPYAGTLGRRLAARALGVAEPDPALTFDRQEVAG